MTQQRQMGAALSEILAKKTAEIEALGLFEWTYHKPCRWCAEGYEAVPSSVSDAMVHPDSPVGRAVCAFPRDAFENPNFVYDRLTHPD